MKSDKISPIDGAVLIADDHDLFRLGLGEVLRNKLGVAELVETGTFYGALEILEQTDVKLAIFDLNIPGMTHCGDLEAVRRKWPDILVVVLSGSEDRNDILSSLKAGVHGYLLKSEPMDAQIDHLQLVLSGMVYVPPLLPLLPKEPEPVVEEEESDQVIGSYHLTKRQAETLECLVQGMTNKQIARKLGLKEGTVKMHVSGVKHALGVRNRTEAAAVGHTILEDINKTPEST